MQYVPANRLCHFPDHSCVFVRYLHAVCVLFVRMNIVTEIAKYVADIFRRPCNPIEFVSDFNHMNELPVRQRESLTVLVTWSCFSSEYARFIRACVDAS